ncbi:uncharacterized protein METZ01_LOCUS245187, partial [marine metagenome]
MRHLPLVLIAAVLITLPVGTSAQDLS